MPDLCNLGAWGPDKEDGKLPWPLASSGKAVPLAGDPKAYRATTSLRERMRLSCLTWADHGFGVPVKTQLFYVLKNALWFWGYTKILGYSAAPAPLFSYEALGRGVLYNLMFEMCGLGCASGPLTARFTLPFTVAAHFLWPGSIKLPYRFDFWNDKKAAAPFVGNKRTLLDVGAFLGLGYATVQAITAPTLGAATILPVVLGLFAIGFLDYTIFLAARAEVYGYMAVCLLAPSTSAAITALKCHQLAIWLWAGISKLGIWFPESIKVSSRALACSHACVHAGATPSSSSVRPKYGR